MIRDDYKDENRLFYWEHEGSKAVRQGNWKLVSLYQKPCELYNILEDSCEMNDLFKSYSEIVDNLTLKYKKWTSEHGVQPWPLINK